MIDASSAMPVCLMVSSADFDRQVVSRIVTDPIGAKRALEELTTAARDFLLCSDQPALRAALVEHTCKARAFLWGGNPNTDPLQHWRTPRQ